MLRQQSANSTNRGSCINFLMRELLSRAWSMVSSSCRRWGFSSKSLSSSDSPATRERSELQTCLRSPSPCQQPPKGQIELVTLLGLG